MRARDQLVGAVILVVATYFGVLRIAEAKCDEAVGSLGLALDGSHPDDLASFRNLQTQLTAMGQKGLAERLDDLRDRGQLWVAPGLGPERWAAYVQSLGLVKRIYIRRLALLNPLAHLYPRGAPDVPPAHQAAFAWLSLGGAMRHELAHFDGAIEEADAYLQELAWYAEIQDSTFVLGLGVEDRAAWDWGLESAILSARKAARLAGANLG
jgi:hypothetical protein